MNSKLIDCLAAKIAGFTILAIVASGCTAVPSQSPLSDEETSRIDERLIGHWRLVDTDNEADPDQPRFVVGRTKDAANTMQLAFTELANDDTVKVHRIPIFTTTIDRKHYLSVSGPHKDIDEYVIFQYGLVTNDERLQEDDELRLFAMKADVLVDAIEEKRLSGRVQRFQEPIERTADNPFKRKYKARITATTAELTTYVEEHEAVLFNRLQPVVLRRCRPIWR